MHSNFQPSRHFYAVLFSFSTRALVEGLSHGEGLPQTCEMKTFDLFTAP